MVGNRGAPMRGRFICAWCGKDLGPSGTPEDSHGICPECAAKLQEQTRQQRAIRRRKRKR